ncbi:hypothetical protein ACO0LB_14575 [Undibacterium sp. SXout7W]|uniref:hypothetical protein n=1 Tax=Undibacterium sp. SXout7W TaxID=3413049 RepID=UPI003BF2283A
MNISPPPLVVILTFCFNPDNLYGTLLTFKTLRVGFPDAKVLVVDNASHPVVRSSIRESAFAVGAEFIQYEQQIPHHFFIRQTLHAEVGSERPLVFADPDLLFWEPVLLPEGDYLVAGRKLPSFYDSYTDTFTEGRLHTSLLMIPSVKKLTDRMLAIESKHWEMDVIRPVMIPEYDRVRRFDTFGVFSHMAAEFCHSFSEPELDRYDHIFCGSHVDLVASKLHSYSKNLVSSHQQAITDYRQLKGLWRQQEHMFLSLALPRKLSVPSVQDGTEPVSIVTY